MYSETIHRNLQNSALYEPVIGDSSSRQWLVQSIGGEAIELKLDAADNLTISASLLISAPELINISVLREIAEMLAERGCQLLQAQPAGKRTMRFVVARQLAAKYVLSPSDMEAEMAMVDMAGAAVLRLLERIAESAQLNFIDLSMFIDMDLALFEITELLHRRFFEFESWDEVCAAAGAMIEDREAAAEAIRQLRAFELFERKNPHIQLAEVVQYVVVAASEITQNTMPGPLEIN